MQKPDNCSVVGLSMPAVRQSTVSQTEKIKAKPFKDEKDAD